MIGLIGRCRREIGMPQLATGRVIIGRRTDDGAKFLAERVERLVSRDTVGTQPSGHTFENFLTTIVLHALGRTKRQPRLNDRISCLG